MFFHTNLAKAPAHHLCCRCPLEKGPQDANHLNHLGVSSPQAWSCSVGSGGVRGGGQATLHLSRVFSDDSCFGVWVCGFYGQLPGWWGSWELAPFSSPSRCFRKINTPRLPHPTQMSLQTDSRDWAAGVVTHGPEVSSLCPNRTPCSSSSFYLEGPLGCQPTLCF